MNSLESRKAKLQKDIASKRLHEDQYKEIYTLLKDCKHPYTLNNNGVWSYLDNMDPKLLSLLEKHVSYSMELNVMLKKDQELRQKEYEYTSNSLVK